MTQYNLTAAFISLAFVAGFFYLVRRQRLGILHTMWWGLASLSVLLLGFFPKLSDWGAGLLGISYPPVLPIVLAICFLLLKVLTMDMEKTSQETRIRILTQKMAAYEAELAKLKDKESKSE